MRAKLPTAARASSLGKSLLSGESRWIAAGAALVAAVLQFRLPEALSIGPSALVPAVSAAIIAFLLGLNPGRLNAESKNLRALSIGLIAIMTLSNLSSLGLLLHSLLNGSSIEGRRLVYAAVEIWFTGVIVFGLWLWELDRGGPLARSMNTHVAPDLLFPQMVDPSLCHGPWMPTFLDYLYVSLTNSTAFSPTDTMPLTGRVKMLMSAESLASLATIAVVGARAVNILK